MGSLADAAGKFAEKFADVLDVFDLSFFVAGSAALGAFLIWLGQEGVDLPEDFSTDRALVAVIIAYVLGLASFALGRAAREAISPFIFRARGTTHPLAKLYVEHDLERVADFSHYAERWSALYSRLWVLIRTERKLRETYALVRRYWVLGAAYDGLAIAALLWMLPVRGLDVSLETRVVLVATLLIAAVLSWRQAQQYHRYQVDELAATAAHWHLLESAETEEDDDDDGDGVDSEG